MIARVRRRLPLAGAAVAVTVLAWPVGVQQIATGLDASWMAGLHMAAHSGLTFGRDVVFSYGPLGYLVAPTMYFASTGVLAIVAHLVVGATLAFAILGLLRRGLSWPWALVVGLPILLVLNQILLVDAPTLTEVCLLLVTLWALSRLLSPPRPWHVAYAVAPAALSILVLFIKLDAGLGCLLLVGYAAACLAARTGGVRLVATQVAVLAVTVLIVTPMLWLLIGQPLGALPEWLTRSGSITQGYSSAMGLEAGGTWEYTAALVLFVVLMAAVVSTPRLALPDRVTIGVLVVGVAYLAFRQGFVRHDFHSVEFFAMLVVIPLAFVGRWEPRHAVVLVVGPLIALLAIANINTAQLVAPGPKIDAIRDSVRLTLSSGARTTFIDTNRARLRESYALPPQVIGRLQGRTVDIEPWELTIAYAYPTVHWRQIPVLQTYAAYTNSLDRLDADFLSGSRRPEFVLRQPDEAIDGRLPRFESPAATVALVCHYRTVYADTRWQLLEATPNRCGTPRQLSRQTTELGEQVPVPAAPPGSLVVGRFDGLDGSTWDSLRALAFKPPELYFRAGGTGRARFLPGHQTSPHLLAGPDCALTTLGDPAAYRTIRISDRANSSHSPYTVEFQQIPYSC